MQQAAAENKTKLICLKKQKFNIEGKQKYKMTPKYSQLLANCPE